MLFVIFAIFMFCMPISVNAAPSDTQNVYCDSGVNGIQICYYKIDGETDIAYSIIDDIKIPPGGIIYRSNFISDNPINSDDVFCVSGANNVQDCYYILNGKFDIAFSVVRNKAVGSH